MGYYVKPQHVSSPKTQWRLDQVLYDGGFGEWSAATGQWGEDGQWSNVLAIRWNGNDRKPLGVPQSRGIPVWFIVPEQLETAVREAIKQVRANKQTECGCITRTRKPFDAG